MDFGLSEEQQLLQETVRGFVAAECPPKRVRALFDAGDGRALELWKGMGEIGLLGLALPERFGGAGLELLDLALVCELLGAGAVPGPFFGHALAGLAIAQGGSDAQRQRWLPRLASGELVGTVALGEGGDRWEPDSVRTELSNARLRGEKRYVPCGELADLIVVSALGGQLAVVERGAHGLALRDEDGSDRGRPIASLSLRDTPCEALATPAAGRLRDAGLGLLAADSFGAAWRLIEMTVEYARTRQQFGQPIAQFQAVKHQLANLATEIEPARGLYWYAAHAFDHLPDEAERVAAIAKAHLTDRALEVARACVELHGGIGFTWECDVQIWLKRAIWNRGWLGTPDLHRERSAALAGW
jgi:alkylation response protein AidB-like acyl-CoA dehydrogenase